MTSMKSIALSLLLLATLSALRADDAVSVNLVTPPSPAPSGTEIAVEVLWLNRGDSPRQVSPPPVIDATLRRSQAAWPVRLRESAPPAGDSLTLARGGFAQRTYLLTVPAEAQGALVIQVEQPFAARTMLEVAPAAGETDALPTPSAVPAEKPGAAAAPALRPTASRLHRTVLENFGFHEPIYFLYGPDEPAAKFQLSFRYRLAGHRDSPVETDPPAKGLYFAYTQRSLWDIKEPSSPFYGTSYMPELMFESLAADHPDRDRLVNFLGYQTGHRHESNGRDGLDSRSLDIVFVRPAVMIGRREGWRAVVAPRLFAYLGESSDNPDIDDYRGHGELLLSFGRDDGLQVNITAIAGREFDKGSVQVDLTYPLQIEPLDFDTYLHFQYFDGHGESLRDYDSKSSTWRAGLSLVR